MAKSEVTFRVWGCRGSLPVPGTETIRFGGDTSCYEIEAGDGTHLVVDCGSGLRGLGADMMVRPRSPEMNVLLSHPHFDHLIGLGFFKPLLKAMVDITVWSDLAPGNLVDAMRRMYSPPLWPVTIPGDYPIGTRVLDKDWTTIGSARVRSFPLNHPGGSSGFRIEILGRVICFITDHEHGDARIDAVVAEMVKGADLLVYDAAYSDSDYACRKGWGHSTHEVGNKLAGDSGVAQTLLVHHAPEASDHDLDHAASMMIGRHPQCRFGRDGMEIAL